MTVYGKEGIRELALHNLAKAQYASQALSRNGAKLLFASTPRFHEFVLVSEESPDTLNARLLGKKIIGGLSLQRFYPELGNATLWCATELTTREQIDKAASVVAGSRSRQPALAHA
jgi:glycine dehydrogenase subunit 1